MCAAVFLWFTGSGADIYNGSDNNKPKMMIMMLLICGNLKHNEAQRQVQNQHTRELISA